MMTATPSPTLSGGSPPDLAWEGVPLNPQVPPTPLTPLTPLTPPPPLPRPQPAQVVAEITVLRTRSVTTSPTIPTEDWAAMAVGSATAGSAGRVRTYLVLRQSVEKSFN